MVAISVTPYAWVDGALDRRRVTECALARICGSCRGSLGRPIAFVGTAEELQRNEFHAPPLHVACAADLVRDLEPTWDVVHTAGFEYVRPAREDPDPRPRFVPNSLIAG